MEHVNPCLNCMAGCCGLAIILDRNDFNRLSDAGHRDLMVTRTDKLIAKSPRYEPMRDDLDDMHSQNFAEMKQGDDGLCVALDRKTRLCTIYEDRPKVCADYTTNKCSGIRECIS